MNKLSTNRNGEEEEDLDVELSFKLKRQLCVWEAAGPNRAPGCQPKLDYNPQKSLSPCPSTWLASSFQLVIVSRGSFDSNIPGKA